MNHLQLLCRAAEKGERDLAHSTVSNVGHQMQHLRHLLEQKRMAVGEAIDSWQKFLNMFAAVSQWSKDKRALLDESLAAFATIAETKQKLQVGTFRTIYMKRLCDVQYSAKRRKLGSVIPLIGSFWPWWRVH